MPYVEAEPLRLPFSGTTPISRHCSYEGAQTAAEHAGRLALKLFALYASHGPQTDAEAAMRLGVGRSSINSTRANLVRLGLVQAVGTKKNPETGVNNTTWGKA